MADIILACFMPQAFSLFIFFFSRCSLLVQSSSFLFSSLTSAPGSALAVSVDDLVSPNLKSSVAAHLSTLSPLSFSPLLGSLAGPHSEREKGFRVVFFKIALFPVLFLFIHLSLRIQKSHSPWLGFNIQISIRVIHSLRTNRWHC
jgi:hypothetical protein